MFLEISQNSQENSCARVPEYQRTKVCNFIIKETLAQKFSCEFCKISKNTFLHRPTPVVASITNYLIIVLIKMRLLLFLVFSQYELACKHGIIFHISITNWSNFVFWIAFSNTWCNRSSRPEVFSKKGVLRNFAKFTWKLLCQSLFFNKVAGPACNFIKKETLAQVFSCEFYEISKNTFFHRTPLMAASGVNQSSNQTIANQSRL